MQASYNAFGGKARPVVVVRSLFGEVLCGSFGAHTHKKTVPNDETNDDPAGARGLFLHPKR